MLGAISGTMSYAVVLFGLGRPGAGDSERKGSQLAVSHVLTAADMGVGC